jgi:hypothetical protein
VNPYLRRHATPLGIIVGALAGVLTVIGMHTVYDARQAMPLPTHSTSVEGARHAAVSMGKYFPGD